MELASGMNTIIPLCAIGIRNGERKAKKEKKKKERKEKRGKKGRKKNWKKRKRRKTKNKWKRDAARVWGEQRK